MSEETQKIKIIIYISSTSKNLLNETYLSRKELESVLSQLEYWNQGQNHLIFNFIGGRSEGLCVRVRFGLVLTFIQGILYVRQVRGISCQRNFM